MSALDPRCRQFWRYPDPHQLIPTDPTAELTVAGCAVATDHGARLAIAAHQVHRAHFHDVTLGRLLDAAGQLEPGLSEAARIRQAAELADAHEHQVAHIVADRSCAFDTSGWFAHRVLVAEEARYQINRWLHHGEQLGVDIRPLLVDSGHRGDRYRAQFLAATPARLERSAAA